MVGGELASGGLGRIFMESSSGITRHTHMQVLAGRKTGHGTVGGSILVNGRTLAPEVFKSISVRNWGRPTKWTGVGADAVVPSVESLVLIPPPILPCPCPGPTRLASNLQPQHNTTNKQAYVDQNSDLHSPYMTAGEVLHFSAELRLSRQVRVCVFVCTLVVCVGKRGVVCVEIR